MGVIALGLLVIVAGAAGYYYWQQTEEGKPKAAAAEGEVAGEESATKSRFNFGGKKKEGEGEAAKATGEKKEGFFAKTKMPKIPNKNDVQMMMMKQSMTSAFK